MDTDKIRSRLRSLQESAKVGSDGMIEQGRERGKIGEPVRSQEDLDTIEIQAEQSYKALYEDTVKEYYDAITAERANIDSRLLGKGVDTAIDPSKNPPVSATVRNRFSDVIEEHRTDLTIFGGRAKGFSNNLNQFKTEHNLKQAAEYPKNRWRSIIIILAWILCTGIAMYALLASQNESLAFADIFWTVFLVVSVNSIVGIMAAESWRARKHQFSAFRIGSVFTLIFLALIAIAINLGSGHYRDALDPEFPAYSSDTTNLV